MMESSSLEEVNTIKDVRNLVGLKKEIDDSLIKDIKNLFRLKKESKAIKDRILRNVFAHDEEELKQSHYIMKK